MRSAEPAGKASFEGGERRPDGLSFPWPEIQLAQSGGGSDLSSLAKGLFGTIEFRSSNLEAFPQWLRVLDELERLDELIRLCDEENECLNNRFSAWRARVNSLENRHPRAQMDELNRFINEIMPYLEDSRVYGRSDYWAAPQEFLRHSGDCEDYAILKYASLKELGFPEEDMRIVVLEDTLREVPHAVLAVDYEDETFILDNNFSVVLNDDELPQYAPQYSVNATHRWVHISPSSVE
ncbi:transglutaminase-like cysteine peptidase [Fodinicurvata halophila]|uniref:Transglutaminase-like cysteine peptidase n=1 Tax=Fodinicurvata halophila TaxID=1419723 RepID=A0ABV8UJP6_9PROT